MASLLRQLPRQRVISSLQTANRSSLGLFSNSNNHVNHGASQTCAHFSSLTTATATPTANPTPTEIYRYNEPIGNMTNEELNDPSTIPGFSTLIHSPPLDRTATPRNALVGKVVSDKMNKTVNVEVDRYKIIPKYGKRVKYSKKFMAHDEEEVCKEGDLVMIVPCQRISRKKHFRVFEIIRQKGNMIL
mmetsp:Transcript_3926/g.5997  ORF Transcript_3926/g.5997 Transcript_3926/m.5997 type:complete len:188 (-) Transcript_3926:1529-2092(-)